MNVSFVCLSCNAKVVGGPGPETNDKVMFVTCSYCGAKHHAKYVASAMGHPGQIPLAIMGLVK